MEKSEIKEIINKIRHRNETVSKTKIAHYEDKQKEYVGVFGDNKSYALQILDESIRLALVGDIFDEIDIELESQRDETIDINGFEMPTKHPYGMLNGYTNACEKESVLAMILKGNIMSGFWHPFTTKHSHPTMVMDSLLEETENRTYLLTEKAKGLLYAVYHKVKTEA